MRAEAVVGIEVVSAAYRQKPKPRACLPQSAQRTIRPQSRLVRSSLVSSGFSADPVRRQHDEAGDGVLRHGLEIADG